MKTSLRVLSILFAAVLLISCALVLLSCNDSGGANGSQGSSAADAGGASVGGSSDADNSAGSGAGISWQDSLARSLAAASPLPGAPAQKDRPNETGRTWYQVFIYSFCDANGDGIGDLRGVTERLDYIHSMGFDGIWLSPIHPSQTYHKYDVDDYYAIDPAYGTMDDFDSLVAACDELGLKILLDLVLNHTSIDHPWFDEHPEYYHIQDEPGGGQWKQLPNGKYYECQFWDRMPDLNLETPALREEIREIVDFWFGKGVYGFRLDAVKEYESGNNAMNIEILTWFNSMVKSIKPDAYLVGENWTTNNSLYTYYQSGVDSFFDFPNAGIDGLIAKTLLQNKPVNNYFNALLSSQDLIRSYNPTGTSAPFFTNHDNARAAGFMRRDENMIKTAWGMTLMQPGDAFVYYGEELGMSGSGQDENKRAPMFWTDDPNAAGMAAGPPGREVQAHSFAPAVAQVEDENSIFSYMRKAVLLRAKYPEIGRGDISVIDLDKTGDDTGGTGVVVRTWNGASISVIYNVSPDETVLYLPGAGNLSDYLSATGAEAAQDGSNFTLPGYTIAILDNTPPSPQ